MEKVSSAGVDRGSNPHSIRKRLLVLCGHEPTLDPRIDWAARAGSDAGYEVMVRGFVVDDTRPKFDDPEEYTSSRGDARKIGEVPKNFVKTIISWDVLDIINNIALPIFALFGAISYILWRIIIAPWIILDWIMEKIGIARFTTWVVEDTLFDFFQWVKDTANKNSGHFFRRLREGMIGYNWYFKELILKQAYDAVNYFESIGWSPDVIHANDPDSLLAAVMLKKRFGSRLVYDAHEYGPEAYLMEPTPTQLFFWYEKQMMRHVDAAMTVTPQISQKFLKRYKSNPFFESIPNAPPIPEKLMPLDDPFMRLSCRGRVRVLFQGGFAKNRGVEELIEAWKKVDHDKAVLYIRGPENTYREKLIARADRTGELGKSIFVLPSVPENDLVYSAYNADIGIIPYLSKVENHEGACPNKLGQYMQAGTMVVAVALPFVKSVVDASGCGITFDDNDPEAFANALNKAINDDELRAQCGQKGQKYARNVFNYGAYYPIIYALYENSEIPKDIPHSNLPEGEIVNIDDKEFDIETIDRDGFDAAVAESDKQLGIDITEGVFSAIDVLKVRENAEKLYSTNPLLYKHLLSADVEQTRHKDAQIQYANQLISTTTKNKDLIKAREIYEEAAGAGNTYANFMLGIIYQEGMAVDADYSMAAKYYEIAAKSNHREAIHNLAILYQVGGYNLGQNLLLSMNYYLEAYRLGDKRAALNASSLAINYDLFKDKRIDALQWLDAAVKENIPGANDLMNELLDKLGIKEFIVQRIKAEAAQ